MVEEKPGQEALERLWNLITEQGDEESEERRRSFLAMFQAGRTEEEVSGLHAAKVCAALSLTEDYDTLAALLRGLNLNDEQILGYIEYEHIQRSLPVASALTALQSAGIRPDAQSVLTALKAIDNNFDETYRAMCEDVASDFSDVPF